MPENNNLKHILFEKKIFVGWFGSRGLKDLAKRAFLIFLIVYLPYATIATISNITTSSDKYAAILLSADAFTGYDYWAPPLAFLGAFPSWNLYFNSKGLKTDYIFAADRADFKRVVKDSKYQSVVLVGHGSFNSWGATDGAVFNEHVLTLRGRFEKKKGEWFQLTCPAKDYSSVHLGETVMDEKEGQVYYYNGEKAGNYDFVWDALFFFSHLKAEAREREEAK